MNRYEAGYNLLMILSVVDGDFVPDEGNVIAEYLRSMHAPYVGTSNENPMLTQLDDNQLIGHFKDASFLFYRQNGQSDRKKLFVESAKAFKNDSTLSDRTAFLDIVKKVVTADHKVSKEEGQYMNLLFRTWGLK